MCSGLAFFFLHRMCKKIDQQLVYLHSWIGMISVHLCLLAREDLVKRRCKKCGNQTLISPLPNRHMKAQRNKIWLLKERHLATSLKSRGWATSKHTILSIKRRSCFMDFIHVLIFVPFAPNVYVNFESNIYLWIVPLDCVHHRLLKPFKSSCTWGFFVL